MAEGVGFEPTEALTSTVFKTAAFDHSATSPKLLVSRDRKVSLALLADAAAGKRATIPEIPVLC